MEIEQSAQVIISKKLWNIVHVLLLMLRKGISKSKVMLDLHLMLKRGKLAGKAALRNLLFHHGGGGPATDPRFAAFISAGRTTHYEFSCSSSPAYSFFPTHHLSKRRKKLAPAYDEDATAATLEAVQKVLEIINNNEQLAAVPPSPLVFGRSPMVRPLRITDSPFPARESEEEAATAAAQLNEKADEFIKKFYKDLKLQAATATPYHDYFWN